MFSSFPDPISFLRRIVLGQEQGEEQDQDESDGDEDVEINIEEEWIESEWRKGKVTRSGNNKGLMGIKLIGQILCFRIECDYFLIDDEFFWSKDLRERLFFSGSSGKEEWIKEGTKVRFRIRRKKENEAWKVFDVEQEEEEQMMEGEGTTDCVVGVIKEVRSGEGGVAKVELEKGNEEWNFRWRTVQGWKHLPCKGGKCNWYRLNYADLMLMSVHSLGDLVFVLKVGNDILSPSSRFSSGSGSVSDWNKREGKGKTWLLNMQSYARYLCILIRRHRLQHLLLEKDLPFPATIHRGDQRVLRSSRMRAFKQQPPLPVEGHQLDS